MTTENMNMKPPTRAHAAKPTVLLATTSCYYPAARMVMALSRAGCKVNAVCPPLHPLRKIKSVSDIHDYQGLRPLNSFRRAIMVTQPDLIISGDDLATHHLHELHDREKAAGKSDSLVCKVIEGSFGRSEIFPVLGARSAFMSTAEETGVQVPSTQVMKSVKELKTWIERMGLPVVLKADGTSGGDGVRVARTVSEAESAFHNLQSPPSILRALKRAVVDQDQTILRPAISRTRRTVNAQACIKGREATSTVFCWDGVVLACLQCEVLCKVRAAGHATVMKVVKNSEMKSSVEKVVSRLGLSGFYGFDFMLESATGIAYLIEVNPRATQVGHLTLGSGRDLPAAAFSALTGREIQLSEKLTDKNIIALFPQEWIRDPKSSFLKSAYNDVPWEEPELVRDCVSKRKKQSAWYSRVAGKEIESKNSGRFEDVSDISTPGQNIVPSPELIGK